MEYLAKIVRGKRSENKLFWKYDYLNIKTNEKDNFLNSHQVDYIPDLAGKLNLIESDKHPKFFQSFEQDITNTTNEFKYLKDLETTTYLGRKVEKEVDKTSASFNGRPIRLTPQLLNEAHFQLKIPWKELAKIYGVSLSTIQRKRKIINQPKRKAGRKRKINGNTEILLYSYVLKHQTPLTQQKIVIYLSEIGLKVNQSTVSRTLKRKRISRQVIPYRHPKQKALMPQFWKFVNETIPSLPQSRILATDESGFPLNLALRYGYAPKGQKVNAYRLNYSENYSLILLIQNVASKGVIHWKLVKGAVNTEIFYNFLSELKLPTNDKHCLLIDNVRFHHAKKIKELLINMSIEPTYIVPYFPQLNPTELIFNVIKQYVRKCQPKTEEELRNAIAEIVNKLQKEDLTKYFKSCLCYDFTVIASR